MPHLYWKNLSKTFLKYISQHILFSNLQRKPVEDEFKTAEI